MAPPDAIDWRSVLTDPEAGFVRGRRLYRLVPSAPRCKLCNLPFAGPGGAIFRLLGFRRWERNPTICRSCISGLERIGPGGAEIEATLLFADVRGSTGLAEAMSAGAYSKVMSRFYQAGCDAIVGANGVVKDFVGDEVVGLFFAGVSGPRHAAAAIGAGQAILAALATPEAAEPVLPVGVAVHTGTVYVGTVGDAGQVHDFTALGDTVNTAARLASSAGAGELLASVAAMRNAGMVPDGLDHRTVALRGRAASVDVVVVGPDSDERQTKIGSRVPGKSG